MKYFTTVTRFNRTTKLGQLLSDKVYKIYNCAIISEEQAVNLPHTIEDMIAGLVKENPRLRPMEVFTRGYDQSGINPKNGAELRVVNEKFDCHPFILAIIPVCNESADNSTSQMKFFSWISFSDGINLVASHTLNDRHRYYKAIVPAEEAESIQKTLEDEMSALHKEYPGTEPVEFRTIKNGGIISKVQAYLKNRQTIRPFCVNLEKINADYTEKGGLK